MTPEVSAPLGDPPPDYLHVYAEFLNQVLLRPPHLTANQETCTLCHWCRIVISDYLPFGLALRSVLSNYAFILLLVIASICLQTA